MSCPRTLIVADRASQAAVIESYVGLDDSVYFTNAVTEIVAADGTVLEHCKLQRESEKPWPLPRWRRVSTYVWDNTRTANPGWGWNGKPRRVLAYAADSGEQVWSLDSPVAPCSLAVSGPHAVFHDGSKLVCANSESGGVAWTVITGRSTPAETAFSRM